MARGLTTAMAGATAASVLRPAFLAELVFGSGTLRLWTGIGTLSWDSETWYGAYGFAGVTTVSEGADISASGYRLSLSGIPGDLLTSVLTDATQAEVGTLYFALLNESGVVIGDPAVKFRGYMDVPEILDEGGTCTVSVNLESRLRVLERSSNRKYTDSDQGREYAGDLGMQWAGQTGAIPFSSEWFKNGLHWGGLSQYVETP